MHYANIELATAAKNLYLHNVRVNDGGLRNLGKAVILVRPGLHILGINRNYV